MIIINGHLYYSNISLMDWAVLLRKEKMDGRGQGGVERVLCRIHRNSNEHKCPHNRPTGALIISISVVLQKGLRVGSYSNGMNHEQLYTLVFKVHDSGHYSYVP